MKHCCQASTWPQQSLHIGHALPGHIFSQGKLLCLLPALPRAKQRPSKEMVLLAAQ